MKKIATIILASVVVMLTGCSVPPSKITYSVKVYSGGTMISEYKFDRVHSGSTYVVGYSGNKKVVITGGMHIIEENR